MLSGRNTACARCFSRGPVASLPECSWIPACAGMTGRSLSSSDEPGPPCVSGGGHSRRPRPTCHSRGSGNPQDRPIRPCSGRSGSLGRASPRLLVLNTPPGFPPSNVSGGGHSRRPRPTCHSRGSGNPQDRPIRPCSGRSGSLGWASQRLLVHNTPPGFPPAMKRFSDEPFG